jgi:large subunit ribosomal protein L19
MKAKQYTRETILQLGVHDRKFPALRPGDRVRITQLIVEGDNKRSQQFEGDIICIRNHGIATNFTVRKMGAGSVAIERVFPYYSPLITDIALVRRGMVRRAKLYYVRHRVGKASRIDELIVRAEGNKKAGVAEATSAK